MEMKKYKLGEIADIIVGYPFESAKFNTDGNGVLLVRGMNVSERFLRFGDEARYWDYITDDLKPYYLKENDIVIGMDGSKVGKNFTLVKKENLPLLLVQRVACVRAKKDYDQRYIWQYVSSKRFIEYVNTIKTGSSIPHISGNQIANFPIFVPDSKAQKKIADVLSSLDDKIALNRRMNEKLEQMAKRLYDHWFVQFDFPNADGKPYKASGGKMVWNETLKREIPDGWEVKRLGDVCEIFNGATPLTAGNDNYGGDIIWITPKDLSEQKSKFVYQGTRNITQKGYNSCSTTFVPKGTVVMSSRAPIGLLSIAMCELCTNQGFKNLVPKNKDYTNLLYYTLLNYIPQIQNLGTGTTFKEVSKEKLSNFSVLYPSDNFIKMFAEKTLSIFNYQLSIEKEIEKLTALRDRLLPLLMNGQVEVE